MFDPKGHQGVAELTGPPLGREALPPGPSPLPQKALHGLEDVVEVPPALEGELHLALGATGVQQETAQLFPQCKGGHGSQPAAVLRSAKILTKAVVDEESIDDIIKDIIDESSFSKKTVIQLHLSGSSMGMSTLPAGLVGSDRSSRGRFMASSLDVINPPTSALPSTPVPHHHERCRWGSSSSRLTEVKTPRALKIDFLTPPLTSGLALKSALPGRIWGTVDTIRRYWPPGAIPECSILTALDSTLNSDALARKEESQHLTWQSYDRQENCICIRLSIFRMLIQTNTAATLKPVIMQGTEFSRMEWKSINFMKKSP
ncbi:hypothetical protein UY3_03406 [Chelonia mydas]|uniref:Uncharacterized protein n=1 Tax=Chelonia mydas TaxID=8469 RepID=M7BQ83_CHEMY|nr:hypothetical protein UY3_03406 [Chelonia mydas]